MKWGANWGINYRVVVPPKDVGGRLRAVCDDAGEVHGAALLQVDVRPAQDLCVGLCDGQPDDVARGRGRRDLALVLARVPVRHRLDLQQVVLGEHLVDGAEAQVRGVRQAADGEQVRVGVAKPGHLHTERTKCTFSISFGRHLVEQHYKFKGDIQRFKPCAAASPEGGRIRAE